MTRRFPLPWTVEHNEDAYWVQDASGKKFAFTYYRSDQAGVDTNTYLTEDEAKRLATKVSQLPGLLGAFKE